MTQRIARQSLAEKAIVHEAAVIRMPTTVDRNFELPTSIYGAMAALFAVAAGVMAFGFAAPGMVVPTGIIAIFIAMFFAVPTQWVRMKPANPQSAMTWSRFQREGIITPYGHTTAQDAAMQVLILPAVILAWAIAVVTIGVIVG